MPRPERRAAIIEATTPLLEQHGELVTTRQIAEAAGVAEGTIFRAFDSLQDVIDATITDALSAARLERVLQQQTFPGTLDGDVAAAIDVIGRYYDSVRIMVHLGHASPSSGGDCARDQLADRYAELRHFLAARFTPHADQLGVTPEDLAQYVVFVVAGQRGHTALGPTRFSVDALTGLILRGARKELA